jgi:FkbH-like protein
MKNQGQTMDSNKSLSYYMNKSKEITGEHSKKIKIALLSSFTINGLKEILQVKSAERNISCMIYEAPYNQYSQEILNQNSNIYRFAPEITFLLIDTRSIFGEVFRFPYSMSISERKGFIEKKINEIKNLIDIFVEKTNSKLVITKLNTPSFSPYGIFELKTEYSFHDMIEDFNQKLIKNYLKSENVFVYDFEKFVSKNGEDNVFDYKQFFFGDLKVSMEFLPALGQDLMKYIIPYLGLTKKCIVIDLDNTLWGGIVGEDGYNGIKLGPEPPGNAFMEFQRVLLSLHQRGIILAINSKNNVEEAMKVIKEHPYMVLREENFAAMRINWKDKVSNMKELAQDINIGLDSLIFIDDDPVNREFVKSVLPEVLVVDVSDDPSNYASAIENLIELSVLKITDEDKNRGKMYFKQKMISELEEATSDLQTFLKKLDLKIIIKNVDEFTLPRVSQLILKTNQFNLTTKRYQEADIKKMIQDPNFIVGCAQVEDKFGDNGITCVFIIKKENEKEWMIDTFLMSCRIMGRDIEKGILTHIINHAKEKGVEKIKAKFIPSQKNKPIENFLPDSKFTKIGEFWTYTIKSKMEFPQYLTVKVE